MRHKVTGLPNKDNCAYDHVLHVTAVAQDCRDGLFSGTNDWTEKLTGKTNWHG
jgi:hypothetical protein